MFFESSLVDKLLVAFLPNCVPFVPLHGREGERALGLALGIANEPWDGEKSARLGDALCELIDELK